MKTESKTVTLREDAKDIKIIQFPSKTKQGIGETMIIYISESHEHKTCVHVVPGLWEEDTINNNIVKLK